MADGQQHEGDNTTLLTAIAGKHLHEAVLLLLPFQIPLEYQLQHIGYVYNHHAKKIISANYHANTFGFSSPH